MLDYYLFTDKGGREVNEDCIRCSEKEDRKCFVLCDGLGGHGMGDEASSLVADTIIEIFKKSDRNDDLLEKVLDEAQKVLIETQKLKHAEKKMKTTAVVLLTDSEYARIGYVGDSRLYIFRHNRVEKRTLDHSVPQMLVLSKRLKEEEIRNHPDRNRLLRVMGVEWDKPMYVVLDPIKVKKCQAFLLCSDGFWECIEEEKMESALKKTENAEKWVSMMLQNVQSGNYKQLSDMDNYSAIAVINKWE